MNQNSNSTDSVIDEFPWLESFVPNRWWPGGWLQTVSIKTLRPSLDVDRHPGTIAFDVPDDQTPPDVLSGYYLPPTQSSDKPTVIVFHGMGGDARSGYMRSMAMRLLDDGYPVILWNNRGAGGSARNCRRLHHPGYTDDVNWLLDHLRQQRGEWTEHGLAAVAFSLGANLLLRYLAETGSDSDFEAAVSISAPIDLELTSQLLRKGWNKAFDRYLLAKQKQELLRPAAEVDEQERAAIESAGSVWELDDRFTALRFGYEDATSYYRDNSAIHVLDQIRTPTLLIHADDDPVVDDDVFRQREWDAEGPLFPALARAGGHTGFLDANGDRWHERMAINFLDLKLPKSTGHRA